MELSWSGKRGLAALVMTLLIGGVVVEVAAAGLLVGYFLNESGFGASLSLEALVAARSGVEDGVLQVVRNKNIDYTTSGSPYILPINSRTTATIIICKDSRTVTVACDTPQAGKHEVTATGITQSKQRKMRATLNVNSATGDVRIESFREILL